MIPEVSALLAAHGFLARRFGWQVSPNHEDLVEALVDARIEAERLPRDLLLRSREIAGGALTFEAFAAWLAERMPPAPR